MALRIVIREGFGQDMADMLRADIHKAVDRFEAQAGYELKVPLPPLKH